MDFAQIFREFSKIVQDFSRIFRDFSRILNKPKLLGVRLHPVYPRLLHQCFNLMMFSSLTLL